MDHEEQMNEMNLRQADLQNSLMKQSLLLEQEVKASSNFKTIIN